MRRTPRDYQINAATSVWNGVHARPHEDPLVVMPTGSGKSLVMAMVIEGLVTAYPHVRIASVVHTEELVAGNYKTLMQQMPHAPAGLYSAGLKKRDIRQITVAGIQSIAKKANQMGRVDFLIVDEAHRISDKDASTYQKFKQALKANNPNLITIGFTATDYRMGTGKLTESGIFDHVCYDLSSGEAFLWMLQEGYLIRPVPKATGVCAQGVDDISIKAGEFDANESAAAFEQVIVPAVDEIILRGQDRQAWLLFAQNIEQADYIAELLNMKGYPTAAIHSRMTADRKTELEKFERGEYRAVVGQNILTTGYDNPRVDLIGMLRLTNSPSLWVQMIGRGTRPLWALDDQGRHLFDIATKEGRLASIAASAKQSCLVLDFAGNTSRLGPINMPNIPRKKKGGGGEPPVRECPKCGSMVHISVKICDGEFDDGTKCDYVFPEVPKLRSQASETEVVIDLTKPPPAKEYAILGVSQMIASRHEPRASGKRPSVKVDYFSGVRRTTAWLFPEHDKGSIPYRKTVDWWRMHTDPNNAHTMPDSIEEFLSLFNQLRKPKHLKVWVNTKYPEIEDYDFRGTRFELPPELGGPPLRTSMEEDIAKLEAARAAESDKRLEQLRSEMFDDEIPF